MLKITGYSDQISVKPGKQINFYVHCEDPTYEAQLVKIRCGDINPEGPGLKENEIDAAINGTYQGRTQEIHAGSYAIIPVSDEKLNQLTELENNFCFETYIYPTLINNKTQFIFDFFDAEKNQGFCLKLNSQNVLEASFGCSTKIANIKLNKPLIDRIWYRISCALHHDKLILTQQPIDKYHQHLHDQVTCINSDKICFPARKMIIGGKLCVSNEFRDIAKQTWNGKIDSPTIVKLDSLLDFDSELHISGEAWTAWNFAKEIPSINVIDDGKLKLNGMLENLPTRGVTGYKFTGNELSWVDCPAHYSAIHFHDDDLYDAKWQSDFSLRVPDNLSSGLYAVRLKVKDFDEYLPFVVLPGENQPKKKLALLFPTATYMAYANEHVMTDPPIGELICQRAIQVSPYQLFLNEHREYGSSLYDLHSDGSGVHYSSRLRPILNMRPKRLFGIGGGSSFLWQFNADTHIIDWLEANEFEYDMITDEELEKDGSSAIQGYSAVMTTTHPEYYSTKMYDALQDYLDHSGRLIYMGGNGFYWKVAFHNDLPGVIEVRRTAGTRAWETGPGEDLHSFNKEVGGLLRYHNRSPNKLCGVGFAAQGFDRSSYYVKTAAAENPRAAFIFENVPGSIIGDFGLIGGGAAGMEIDRFDPSLGSPRHALVVASSKHHSAAHVVAVEDIFNNYLGVDGEQNSLVRADLTFFETLSGGAVFSTGSISWSGSLSYNDYQNSVSQITKNVLNRFLAPEPFNYIPD